MSKNYPFWTYSGTTVKIRPYSLGKFLADEGFGNYKNSGERTEKGVLFRNRNGILETHSADSIKKFVQTYVENDEIHEYADEDERVTFLDTWISKTANSIETYLSSLPSFTEDGEGDSNALKIFRDTKDECYIPFKNGVVSISKNKTELLPWEKIGKRGAVWETSIRDHVIELPPEVGKSTPVLSTARSKFSRGEMNAIDLLPESPFVNFITYAFKHNVEPKEKGNKRDEGTESARYKQSVRGFETAFGYLIHRHNAPEDAKCVVFVDADSSQEKAEGGNGKSLSLESLKHIRNSETVDGKRFRKSAEDSSRFNFSNVTHATEFILINDLNPDFDLTSIFSAITDDMEVEPKGRNKIVIPKEKKAKLALTTNYIITGVGGSYERRQHIVEFGNFFNKANKKRIQVPKIIGKPLFDSDFNASDWNGFYLYAIECVGRYLREGLRPAENANYKDRVVVTAVEGKGGSGEVTEWIRNWINVDRVEGGYDKSGIAVEDLFDLFERDYPMLANTKWSKPRLKRAIYEFVMATPELEYNPEQSGKGAGMNERRWLAGPKGEQKDAIKITGTVNG